MNISVGWNNFLCHNSYRDVKHVIKRDQLWPKQATKVLVLQVALSRLLNLCAATYSNMNKEHRHDFVSLM